MKDVDLGEPTSFLDRVYLGCTQWECQISKDIADNYRKMFESKDLCQSYGKTITFREIGCEYFLMVLSWKFMQRNAWKDIANTMH